MSGRRVVSTHLVYRYAVRTAISGVYKIRGGGFQHIAIGETDHSQDMSPALD